MTGLRRPSGRLACRRVRRGLRRTGGVALRRPTRTRRPSSGTVRSVSTRRRLAVLFVAGIMPRTRRRRGRCVRHIVPLGRMAAALPSGVRRRFAQRVSRWTLRSPLVTVDGCGRRPRRRVGCWRRSVSGRRLRVRRRRRVRRPRTCGCVRLACRRLRLPVRPVSSVGGADACGCVPREGSRGRPCWHGAPGVPASGLVGCLLPAGPVSLT